MRNLSTGPNGIFLVRTLERCDVQCGDFSRDAIIALVHGRLLNRHGEVLQLSPSQMAWLRRQDRAESFGQYSVR